MCPLFHMLFLFLILFIVSGVGLVMAGGIAVIWIR